MAVSTILLPHALPFEAMFAELRLQRQDTFTDAILQALLSPNAQPPASLSQAQRSELAEEALRKALEVHTRTYRLLEERKGAGAVGPSTGGPSLDSLEADCWAADQPLKRLLYLLRGHGLALSGGGIRSASFCLGVLEGLARFSCGREADPKKGLLFELQYLSTVSGGGYLGSWLSAWIRHRAEGLEGSSGSISAQTWRKAYRDVLLALAGRTPTTAGDPAAEPARHLRQFTSYLAPQLGFTLDVWALAAIVVRNLLVNWLCILPMLMAMLLISPFIAHLLEAYSNRFAHQAPVFFYVPVLFLLLVMAVTAGFSLPSYSSVAKQGLLRPRPRSSLAVFVWFCLPALLVCFRLTARFYPQAVAIPFSKSEGWWISAGSSLFFGVLALLCWKRQRARRTISAHEQPAGRQQVARPTYWNSAQVGALLLFVTAVTSVFGGFGVEYTGRIWLPKLLGLLPAVSGSTQLTKPFYLLLAPPAFLIVLLLCSAVFSALINRFEWEEDREWWARAGGLLLAIAGLWTVGLGLALASLPHKAWWASLPGLALGLVTSLTGASAATGAGSQPEGSGTGAVTSLPSALKPLLLPGVGLLALALMAVFLLRLTEIVRKDLLGSIVNPTLSIGLLLILFAAFSFGINLLININIFSLHGLYRVRLSRAFLGASDESRRPDPFTHFAAGESPNMTDLCAAQGVPLHLVCTALNLLGTKRAEWRQRKAESFTFSAVSAGSWRLNHVAAEMYGGHRGVSLATAMAISGAAANPNMGYHSSPLVTFIMALFNVRLGWWLPNPSLPQKRKFAEGRARRFLASSSPLLGVGPIISELFGRTDDDHSWIELSDGGHFENLGLYELVMRRAKYIIVVDASADPKYHFDDLGNALRKVEIDLGIPIRFDTLPRMRPGARAANRLCAVATIDYQCADSACFHQTGFENQDWHEPEAMNGKLIYLKSCLQRNSPVNVREYAFAHPAFPHESTGNQFFTEAQFESYRQLGSSLVAGIVGESTGLDWEAFVAAAQAAANGSTP